MHSKKIKILIIILICAISFFNNSFASNLVETSSKTPSVPLINARHAVVIDRISKEILFGKNENEKCKMASTTKIMTAIIVLENCTDLEQIVTISKKAARNRWLKIRFIHK